MPNQKFLFVNKIPTDTVLSRSGQLEKIEIFSHVQNRRRERSRNAALEEPGKHWKKYASSMRPSPSPTGGEERRVRQKTGATAGDDAAAAAATAPTMAPLDWQRAAELAMNLPRMPRISNVSEPFNVAVIDLDMKMHSYLQAVTFRLARMTFITEGFAPLELAKHIDKIRHDDTLQARLKRCISDPMVMYSMLAYGTSLIGWKTGIMDKSRPPEIYIGKTLQAVRERLTQQKDRPPDVWLLFAIGALAFTALWHGTPLMWARVPSRQQLADPRSLEASRLHLQGLVSLVHQLGGWEKTDPLLLDGVILVDKYVSFATHKPTVLSAAEWDPGRLAWPAAGVGPLTLRRDPSGMAVDETSSRLLELDIRDELRAIIRDAIDYVHTATALWAADSRNDGSWCFLRGQALHYRLYAARGDTLLDQLVGHSMLLFLLGCLEDSSAQKGVLLLQRNLRLVLDAAGLIRAPAPHSVFSPTTGGQHYQAWPGAEFARALGLDRSRRGPEHAAERDFLIWCLATAAMLPAHTQARDWFVSHLAALARAGEITIAFEPLKAFLQRYLYLPARQDAQLRRVIDQATHSLHYPYAHGYCDPVLDGPHVFGLDVCA